MPRPVHDSRPLEWHIRSTYVRHRDGPTRLEHAVRLLLGQPGPPETAPRTDGSADHARRHLRPRLDRPAEPRPDD
jgi:hypothetical protein